jgi:hypothetical protein
MRGNTLVRCGGRVEETDREQSRYRASARPTERHEALCDRVEVKDLHRCAVAAA